MPKVTLNLLPAGKRLEVETGSWLHAALSPQGVEFPCGGAGTCHGCRVRVAEGRVEVSPETRAAFTPEEIAAGWRLACRARVDGPLTLEVAQWVAPTLESALVAEMEPEPGVGIAIDLGTTTLAAQLIDLETGRALATEVALNPQSARGTDVMTRIGYALQGGAAELRESVRAELGRMVAALGGRASRVVIAGNTVMHHLFCGFDVEPLSRAPFETGDGGEQTFTAGQLGWRSLDSDVEVRFLPCLGSFVGSDVLAGIMAVGMDRASRPVALVDLGTNGEIAVGAARGILVASAAAGPAFEAGNIRMGMRAAEGAIHHVSLQAGALSCETLGGGPARGICGSGLVSAAAAALDLGAILPNGRLANGAKELPLAGGVALIQADIRQLQLAKGAIAAGLETLQKRCGLREGELSALYLAGAFGNYMDLPSARRIGLLDAAAPVRPAGNASLHGAKIALLAPRRTARRVARIGTITRHVSLALDEEFAALYGARMGFA